MPDLPLKLGALPDQPARGDWAGLAAWAARRIALGGTATVLPGDQTV